MCVVFNTLLIDCRKARAGGTNILFVICKIMCNKEEHLSFSTLILSAQFSISAVPGHRILWVAK